MKKKIVIFILLLCLGAALLICGAAFNSRRVIATDKEGFEDVLLKSEFEIIEDVTLGGLEREESGTLKQTYAPGNAPAACPT